MPLPPVRKEFKFKARDGEIVIPARFGYPGIDMGPAYIIDNDFQRPVSRRTIKSQTEREAEAFKFEDATTKLLGVFSRMKDRARAVGVEIDDVYENLLDTEIMMIQQVAKKLQKNKDKILENGETAERVIYDTLTAEIEKGQQRLKTAKQSGNDELLLNLEKGVSYNKFYLTALINLARGNDLHSLERISGDQDYEKSPIPIADNFQVGQLAFLRSETGHDTKVHSLIRYDGASGDHTEVIAKGLRIAVANMDRAQLARIEDGKTIIVDGREGVIIVNPSQETIRDYKAEIEGEIQMAKYLTGKSSQDKWARTLDHKIIKISGNIAFADEMFAINENNAAAVGLYRTEVAINARYDLGGESTSLEKFVEIYDQAIKASIDRNGKAKSITMRTPDFEGDKDIKLTKAKKAELIENSIKAMCTAVHNNPNACLHIMFPMIETSDQFDEMQNLVYQAASDVGIQAPKTGAMIETPQAIHEMNNMDADFYSVGTNDLIPQLLEYDRYERSRLYDPTDKRVIDALQEIHDNAAQQGKEDALSICGDIASDPRYFALLAGMGYTHLSAGPGEVPFHKELVRRINTKDAEFLVKAISRIDDREKREELLDEFNEEKLGLRNNRTLDPHWKSESNAPAPNGRDFEGN